MPEFLRIGDRIEIPVTELMWRFSRSSGAGGQHVNTTDSRVELVFDIANSKSIPSYLRKRAIEKLETPTITVVSSESRSQFQNRRKAEQRFIQLMEQAIALPPPQRRPTKPTKAAKQKRLDGKHRRSEIKRNRSGRVD